MRGELVPLKAEGADPKVRQRGGEYGRTGMLGKGLIGA